MFGPMVFGCLTGGFVGRFCGGLLGLADGFRGDRAPADFLFSAGGFSGGFFRRIFLLHFATKISTAKSTTSMAVFWQIFHHRLNPRPAGREQIPSSALEPSLKLDPGLSANFLPRLRNYWSMATVPLEIPRRASFKPHRLTGQEIAHSNVRRQAEIHTSKTRMEGRPLKSKKYPQKSSLLKWQPKKMA